MHGVSHGQRQRHTSPRTVAPAIAPPVCERGVELMQQVPVSHVQFHNIEAQALSPTGSPYEGLENCIDLRFLQLLWHVPSGFMRKSRRGDRGPGIFMSGKRATALPGALGCPLPPGMGDLNAEPSTRQSDGPGRFENTIQGPL